jgi:flagellar FliL protein
MADKTEDAPKKKGKGKIIIMAVGFLVLAGGGVGAGLYAASSGMIGGGHAAPEDHGPKLVPKAEQKRGGGGEDEEGGHGGGGGGGETRGASGEGAEKYASNYYAMEKEFTSNLRDSVHFVQLGLAVSTPYDDTVIDNLKTNDIAVRSAILMALGDTTEEEVFSGEGKKQLQKRLTNAINATLKQKEGFGGISNTYFTTFVVQ